MSYWLAPNQVVLLILLLMVASVAVPGLGWRALAGLGPVRRVLVLFLRWLGLVLLALALADTELLLPHRRSDTMLVVDRSASITPGVASQVEAVIRDLDARPRSPDTGLGVVVFGKQALLDRPPRTRVDEGRYQFRSTVDGVGSNLAEGLRLAAASLPTASTRRIVLLSDGNENRGNALSEALSLVTAGIPVDVVPLERGSIEDVIVERIIAPSRVPSHEPFPIRVLLRSNMEAKGTLRIKLRSTDSDRLLFEDALELEAGVRGLTVETSLDQPGLVEVDAEWIPLGRPDSRVENNRASTLVRVGREGRVLLVEESPGVEAPLIAALEANGITVDSVAPESLPSSPATLQGVDSVLLSNIPITRLSEENQNTLLAYVNILGGGLVMLGGPEAFGSGGFRGSLLEPILPIDCDVPGMRVRGSVAMVVILDRSGSMHGQPIEMAKAAALAAAGTVQSDDEIGILVFDHSFSWVYPIQKKGDGELIRKRVRTIESGGGTDLFPALQSAFNALKRSSASVRHVIVLSDGMSLEADWQPLLRRFAQEKMTISAVGVGDSVDRKLMEMLARATGGRTYWAVHPRTLPHIYIEETKLAMRSLIFENDPGWNPRRYQSTELTAGLPDRLPRIRGLNLTTAKPLAQVAYISDQPADETPFPLLAHWMSGSGRVACIMTDSGRRWAGDWPTDPAGGATWAQVVRWSRKQEESGRLDVRFESSGGRASVVAFAPTSGSGRPLDQVTGTLVGPNGSRIPVEFRRVAGNRFRADVDLDQDGHHAVQVSGIFADGSQARATDVLSIPYSTEFLPQPTNHALLANLAMVTGGRQLSLEQLAKADLFVPSERQPYSHRSLWPQFLLLAMAVLLVEVAVRRLAVSPVLALGWLARRFSRKELAKEGSETMRRLKAVRTKVWEQRPKASVQPEFGTSLSSEKAGGPEPISIDAGASPGSVPRPMPSASASPQADAGESEKEGGFSRLMQAKKRVWEERAQQRPGVTPLDADSPENN